MRHSQASRYFTLQIMLWGGPVATVRSRVFFVSYPVSLSLRYLYIRPISRHVCVSVCLSVTGSRRLKTRVLTSTVLFVTLGKSETYKETIVRVLVPQSLVLIAKLILSYSYCTVLQIMLRGGLVATPRSRDFVVTYPV